MIVILMIPAAIFRRVNLYTYLLDKSLRRAVNKKITLRTGSTELIIIILLKNLPVGINLTINT